MNRILITLFLVCCVNVMHGQDIIQKINAIKADSTYYWDTYTHPNADTALVKGIERLLFYINMPNGEKLTVKDITPYAKHIMLRRPTRTMAFAYIKIDDVKSLLDRLYGEMSEAVSDEGNETTEAFEADPIALELMLQADIFAIRDYLENCVESGKISRYGSINAVDDLSTKHIVIIDFDTKKPVCVLSPLTNGDYRQNLINGTLDTISNHHHCYAIWFSFTGI